MCYKMRANCKPLGKNRRTYGGANVFTFTSLSCLVLTCNKKQIFVEKDVAVKKKKKCLTSFQTHALVQSA